MRTIVHLSRISVVLGSAVACGTPVVTTSAPVVVAPANATTIDLTKPPVLGPPPTLAVPPIVTRTLANGLKIVVVEQHELPIADVETVGRAVSEISRRGVPARN